MTLYNVVRQKKSSFLLFFYLYFIIFSSVAEKINTEQEIYKRYQDIRSDDNISRQEKDKLLNQLLSKAVPLKNPLYNALIISRLYYSAQSKGDDDKISEWQVKYDQAVLANILSVYGYYSPKKHTIYKDISRLGVGEYCQFDNSSNFKLGKRKFFPIKTREMTVNDNLAYKDILFNAISSNI